MTSPGWLLDERACAGRENLDAAHVARYDTKEDAGAAAEVALLQQFEEHVRDEHSTFTWLLEPMLARSGFTIESADDADDGSVAAYIARAT